MQRGEVTGMRWLIMEAGWRAGVAGIYTAGMVILLFVFLWVAMFEADKLKLERRRYYGEAG
jgi:hypothetical protein